MGDVKGFLKYNRDQKLNKPVAERVSNFEEFAQPWPEQQYKEQASRCMDCGIPFCHEGCPLGNKIPDFNDAVHIGEWKEAWSVLKTTNNFPEFTGRICPAPCEASCVLGLNNAAVNIEHIEKEIAETAFREGWEQPVVANADTGIKIAVIGSGPAGLAAAEESRKQGHAVTVFERDAEAGGLLRYGIPDFKLDKSIVARRVSLLEQSGIQFKTGFEVGKHITAQELEAKYDATIICTGSTVPRDLHIEGRELKGVHHAMDFLKHQNQLIGQEITNHEPQFNAKGKHVVVIGGGDTGADCVGTSNRHGAKTITQIELLDKPPTARDISNPWPEWPMVMRSSTSHEEGANRDWAVLTKRFIGKEDKLEAIETVKIRWTDKSRFQFEEIPNSEEIIPCDLALLAIGFAHPEKNGLVEQFGLELDPRGNIKASGYRASKKSSQTTRSGLTTSSESMIFAAGDCRRGQSLVVWAIAEGRKAAVAVERAMSRKVIPA